MAIWQNQIFILPKEELDSYFSKNKKITIQDFDNINWWKYRVLSLVDIDNKFSSLLNSSESWSKDLVIYGDNDSDCLHIYLEKNIPVEFSARLDSRNLNIQFINIIVDFAIEKNLAFLKDLSEDNLKIIYPNDFILRKEMSENERYSKYIELLGLNNK